MTCCCRARCWCSTPEWSGGGDDDEKKGHTKNIHTHTHTYYSRRLTLMSWRKDLYFCSNLPVLALSTISFSM